MRVVRRGMRSVHLHLVQVLLVLVLAGLGGCASRVAEPPDASASSLDFDHDWRDAELCAVVDSMEADCCTDARIALPARAASSLDLRGLVSGATGTCGDPTKLVLPADPSAYPLMVLLPAVTGADPSCATGCAGRGVETWFGVVLSLPDALVNGYWA